VFSTFFLKIRLSTVILLKNQSIMAHDEKIIYKRYYISRISGKATKKCNNLRLIKKVERKTFVDNISDRR